MIGLLFSALPFFAACVVAHREPAHRPVRDALGAAFSYSLWTLLDDPADRSPRALLLLWSLVAVYSGWAYLRAFAWDPSEALGMMGGILMLFAGAYFWPKDPIWWQIATWGPFVASSIVGALAVSRWWRRVERWSEGAFQAVQYIAIRHGTRGYPVERLRFTEKASIASIAQRVALILLASDVCMLLFVPWPGVQAWQGRAAAVAVFAVQLEWLLNRKDRVNAS